MQYWFFGGVAKNEGRNRLNLLSFKVNIMPHDKSRVLKNQLLIMCGY